MSVFATQCVVGHADQAAHCDDRVRGDFELIAREADDRMLPRASELPKFERQVRRA